MGPFFQSSAERQEAVSTAESMEPVPPILLIVLGAVSTSESLESFLGSKNKLSSWPQIRRTLYLFARMTGRQEPVGSWGQRN